MFNVNNRNTRTSCEICSKLTIKIPKRRHWHDFCFKIAFCDVLLFFFRLIGFNLGSFVHTLSQQKIKQCAILLFIILLNQIRCKVLKKNRLYGNKWILFLDSAWKIDWETYFFMKNMTVLENLQPFPHY